MKTIRSKAGMLAAACGLLLAAGGAFAQTEYTWQSAYGRCSFIRDRSRARSFSGFDTTRRLIAGPCRVGRRTSMEWICLRDRFQCGGLDYICFLEKMDHGLSKTTAFGGLSTPLDGCRNSASYAPYSADRFMICYGSVCWPGWRRSCRRSACLTAAGSRSPAAAECRHTYSRRT